MKTPRDLINETKRMSYKKFWVYDKGGDRDSPVNYYCWDEKIANYHNNNPVVEVIEVSALDKAVELLQQIKQGLVVSESRDTHTIKLIDAFLKSLEGK